MCECASWGASPSATSSTPSSSTSCTSEALFVTMHHCQLRLDTCALGLSSACQQVYNTVCIVQLCEVSFTLKTFSASWLVVSMLCNAGTTGSVCNLIPSEEGQSRTSCVGVILLSHDRDNAQYVQPGTNLCVFSCRDDRKYVYNNVRRWTTKMRLERWGQPSGTVLECDKLIIPVHLGCHWTCAVINLRDHEIWYFDSLGVSPPACTAR